MSDRELLELAAKAAGIRLHVWGAPGTENFADMDTGKLWNPLADDGDALRLAVKLGFINPGQWPNPGQIASKQWADDGQIDWYAATRLAIVRAAAEIGKAMP